MTTPPTDYDTTIRGLQDRLAQLTRARMRQEHERDQAAATATRLRAQLEAEFGVASVEAAHAKLALLEQQLQDHIAALTACLQELEA